MLFRSLPLRGDPGDADPGEPEDLPVSADGGGSARDPLLSDPTVQTPLRTHQER